VHPKGIAFFVAFLPHFIYPAGGGALSIGTFGLCSVGGKA
jgi:threonine/homoserine/homoserine lactone efflux protein